MAAILIVLVLMGLAAAGGFVAGAAWSGFDEAFADFESELQSELGSEFDNGFESGPGDGGGGFFGEVPGFTPLDTEVVEGDALQPGSRVSGVVADLPVEHTLRLEASIDVRIEVADAEFDTVLVLLDAEGEVVEADDDGGAGNLSVVEVSLSAGRYAVRVQSWSGEAGGSYALAVD